MSDEIDFTTLPLEERLSHKVWKARLSAYEEFITKFEKSSSEDDPVFEPFNKDPTLLKSIVVDSNVVAQETGISLLIKYLEFGATASSVNKIQRAGIVESLCEKGLSSSRAGTKSKTIESLMLIVEFIDSPDLVIEDCLKFVKHRLPKLVTGLVTAVTQIVENFGCVIISPTPIIKVLPGLFSHADKNVRSETTKLTIELYKWMRDSLATILFDDLKPIQQKDLTKAFEQVQNEPAQQKRLTKVQQLQEKQQESHPDGDVEMTDVQQQQPEPQFDPFDLLEPIDVLSKLPSDIESRVNSDSWKERKAVLEEVVEILAKAPKMNPNDDYSDIMRLFTKCMKDANIQVVQLAAHSAELISKGIKNKFNRYCGMILVPLLERNKEKKPSFTLAINTSLDALFTATSLSEILDGTLKTMNHKTPQVKISATDYLQRCLAQTSIAPDTNEVDSIMTVGVKLLSESLEPVRQASTQMIGTLMKITGQRPLNQYLEKVEDNRKAKIIKFFESVTVSATKTSTGSEAMKPTKDLKSNSVIPSKRLASSPAKRPISAQKMTNVGRSLTSRPLGSRNIPTPKLATLTKDIKEEDNSAEELKALKSEQENWAKETEQQKMIIDNLRNENMKILSDFTQVKQTLERVNKEQSNLTLMSKQKDTQILRLTSDVENAKLKIRDLEQTIEMMKLQQRAIVNSQEEPQASPHKETRITSGDLSSRVNRLSIDGEAKENLFQEKPSNFDYNSKVISYASNEDNWKKAEEVTNQLRARIERMKSRSRIQSDL